jgi:CBS-domain-containing membrane protein
MPDELSDVEAKLLIQAMNGRARLLSNLTRSPVRSPWFAIFGGLLNVLILVPVMFWEQASASRQGLLLWGIAAALMLMMTAYIASVDKPYYDSC